MNQKRFNELMHAAMDMLIQAEGITYSLRNPRPDDTQKMIADRLSGYARTLDKKIKNALMDRDPETPFPGDTSG